MINEINGAKPDFLDLYLQFKDNCMHKKGIVDINEIIKLFEVKDEVTKENR